MAWNRDIYHNKRIPKTDANPPIPKIKTNDAIYVDIDSVENECIDAYTKQCEDRDIKVNWRNLAGMDFVFEWLRESNYRIERIEG